MIIDNNTGIQLKVTGGGTIGFGRASWPFATLTADRNFLKLSLSLIGTVIFRPTDIISIEPYTGLRGGTIKIVHSVGNYSSTIIFSGRSSDYLINEIKNTGFLDNRGPLPVDVENEITKLQNSGSFPVKITAAVFFIVVWNLLFLSTQLPFITGHSKQMSFFGARLGLGFAWLFCIGVLFIPPIRQLILKEGRELSEVKGFFYFLLAMSTIMFLAFSIAP